MATFAILYQFMHMYNSWSLGSRNAAYQATSCYPVIKTYSNIAHAHGNCPIYIHSVKQKNVKFLHWRKGAQLEDKNEGIQQEDEIEGIQCMHSAHMYTLIWV